MGNENILFVQLQRHFLLSLYRISIRTKKWPLKIFDHFIDLAVCNSWLEYRVDYDNANLRVKDRMDLLAFRQDIADGLLALSSQKGSRKRGRPRHECNESSSTSTQNVRQQHETAPLQQCRCVTMVLSIGQSIHQINAGAK